jgi:phosphatidylethanolamine/phosphatidyl-N-methylethanolamine N-methyltransferase
LSAVDLGSVASAYGRYAALYDLLFGRALQLGRLKLASLIQAAAGQRILEIGVGTGLMLPLYPRDVCILGVDISEHMLVRARQKVARHSLAHVELRRADAESTGLPGASFDHVVLPYVYSVTPNPSRLVRESFRLCKPGGHLWILNHFSGLGVWDWIEWPLKPFARGLGFRSDFQYKRYVTDQDWDIKAVHKANLLGLSRIVQVRNSDPELIR